MNNQFSIPELILLLLLCAPLLMHGQVGINESNSDPDPSAMLDVESTDKGLLIPRMTEAERDAINQPATGLQIYNTDGSAFNYYDGTAWRASTSPWKVKGDSIYYDEGLVGIGTDAPTEKLTLTGGNFLQTPGNPTHAGAIKNNGTTELLGAANIFISGKYAYVASFDDDGVEILDISDPSNPTHVGAITDNATTALDGAYDIYVSGKYAYVAAQLNNGVEILDISDPSNPTHVGAITDNGTTALNWPIGIFVSGKYAYVASYNDNGIEILDISDPSNPTHVGAITDNGTTALLGASSVFVSGKYAYVASSGDNGVEILDISDPTNPTHVGAITDDATTSLNGAFDIFVSGKYAYVASFFDNGVEILDISDPSNPTHVGAITDNGTTSLNGARSIYVSGKYAYVAAQISDNGVEVLDISDPSNPTHVGAITDNGTTSLNAANGIYVSGKYAYVASNYEGVEILDISGLDAPSASIGNIATNQIDVSEHAQVGRLSVRDGMNVGKDIFVGGSIAANGQVTASSFIGDGSGLTNVGDNLGNHLATQTLDLNGNDLTNANTVTATAFIGNGSGLTNLPSSADDLGDHIATQTLNLNSQNIVNGSTITATSFIGDGSGLTNIPGDNLGNHTATQTLNMNDERVVDVDRIGLGTVSPSALIDVESGLVTGTMLHLDNSYTPSGITPQVPGNIGPFFKINSGQQSDANLSTSGVLIGMEVDLTSSSTTKSYAAIFNGGMVGIGTSMPTQTLHIEETSPGIRLVDERTNVSNVGAILGTMEWYTRDQSFGTSGLNEVASIEVINTNSTATPDTRMDFIVWENDANGANEKRPFSIWPNGNVAVGDGTLEPTKAKLEIFGSSSSYTVSGQSRYYGTGGSNSNNNYSGTFSLYANGNIAANAFIAHSDARIKQIEGLSEGEEDLETLMQIEVTNYRLKDSLAKGNRPVKKVIAQQVATVYPQAVTNNLTEVIPDIYQRAEVQNSWIMLATELKVGDRVKVISDKQSEVYEVIEVETGRFKVSDLSSELSAPSTGSGQVFVYGREVNDFHTVDYEAISMLNVSATQEQQRRIETLEQKNTALQEKVQRLQSLESRLQALEALLSQSK